MAEHNQFGLGEEEEVGGTVTEAVAIGHPIANLPSQVRKVTQSVFAFLADRQNQVSQCACISRKCCIQHGPDVRAKPMS